MFAISNEQMRRFDHDCAQLIPEIILMEHAGRLMAAEILKWIRGRELSDLIILAGPGHNGGDALVCARHLSDQGYPSEIFLLKHSLKPLPMTMLSTLDRSICTVREDGLDAVLPRLESLGLRDNQSGFAGPGAGSRPAVLIDGYLGSGLTRPLYSGDTGSRDGNFPDALSDPRTRSLVELWNQSQAMRFALDLPSGLSDAYRGDWPILYSDVTLAVQFPRACMYTSPARNYCGEIRIIKPGFPSQVLREYREGWKAVGKSKSAGVVGEAEAKAPARILVSGILPDLLSPMHPDSHKGTKGKIDLFGAGRGMAGAAVLAGRAALKSGGGMVRVNSPVDWTAEALSSEPALMFRRTTDDSVDDWASAFLFGPGLGREADDEHIFIPLLSRLLAGDRPLIIDADGLYWLAELRRRGGIPRGPAPVILLPHAAEAAMLLDSSTGDTLRHPSESAGKIISRFAGESRECWVAIKSSVTWIAGSSGQKWVYDGRQPSLGTAGSGDVLSGLTAAFILREGDAGRALPAAVALHQLAASRCYRRSGLFTAAELIPEIGRLCGEFVQLEGERI